MEEEYIKRQPRRNEKSGRYENDYPDSVFFRALSYEWEPTKQIAERMMVKRNFLLIHLKNIVGNPDNPYSQKIEVERKGRILLWRKKQTDGSKKKAVRRSSTKKTEKS